MTGVQAAAGTPLLSQIHGVSHEGSEDPLAGLMDSFTSITPGGPSSPLDHSDKH